MEDVNLISGVNSMYIYQLNDKTYFFFGDKHYSRRENDCESQLNIKCDDFDLSYNKINYNGSLCMSIGSLLYTMFIYNNDHNILTDFYLESSFTKENERTALKIGYDIMNRKKSLSNYNSDIIDHEFDSVSWMTLIEFVMEPCFIMEKSKCPFFPYVRSHYVDIRSIDGGTPIDTDLFILFDLRKYFKSNVSDIESLIVFKKDYKGLLNFLIYSYKAILDAALNTQGFDYYMQQFNNLSQYFSPKFQRFFINKLTNFEQMAVIRNGLRMHRVAAELSRLNIGDHKLASAIKNFIYDSADKKIKNLQKHHPNGILAFFDMEWGTYDYDDWYYYMDETINEYEDELIFMGALSMDAYTLARMFLFNDSENIIVYTGSHHVERYSDFFKMYFSVLPIIETPKLPDNMCLNIIDLPKYFDINKYRTYVKNKQI